MLQDVKGRAGAKKKGKGADSLAGTYTPIFEC